MTKKVEEVLTKVAKVIFFGLTIWWLTIYLRGLRDTSENNLFTLVYPWMALLGGVVGILSARKWGGFQSFLGKALTMLAVGLLLQFFGQFTYAYYIYLLKVDIPYPSLGDIGYFGSVVCYLFAGVYLSKVIALKVDINLIKKDFVILLLPVILPLVSYFTFLGHYQFDTSNYLKVFLDFGYPLGESLYLSVSLMVFLISRHVLGGQMKKPMQFLILALVVQYFADATFLFQANNGSWYVGGLNDYFYFLSYFLMTIGLAKISHMFDRISGEQKV